MKTRRGTEGENDGEALYRSRESRWVAESRKQMTVAHQEHSIDVLCCRLLVTALSGLFVLPLIDVQLSLPLTALLLRYPSLPRRAL